MGKREEQWHNLERCLISIKKLLDKGKLGYYFEEDLKYSELHNTHKYFTFAPDKERQKINVSMITNNHQLHEHTDQQKNFQRHETMKTIQSLIKETWDYIYQWAWEQRKFIELNF